MAKTIRVRESRTVDNGGGANRGPKEQCRVIDINVSEKTSSMEEVPGETELCGWYNKDDQVGT